MEDMKRNIPVCHALNKAGSRSFVIAGGKGGRKPQAKGPGRRQGRLSGQAGILLHSSHGGASGNHIIIQPLSLHRKLKSFHLLAGDFIGHIPLIVYQNPIALAGNVEGNILIGNLAGRSSVLIPHIHYLSVFHKRRKPFAQAIHIFSHVKRKLLQHIGFSCFLVVHVGQIPEAGFRKEGFPFIKSHFISIWCFVYHCL